MGPFFWRSFPSIRLRCTACLDRACLACFFSENFSFNRSFAPCCSFLWFCHLIWMCLFGVMSHGFCGIVGRVGPLRNLFLNFNQAPCTVEVSRRFELFVCTNHCDRAGWWAPAAQHRSPHAHRNTPWASPSPTPHGTRRRATCTLLLRFRVRLFGNRVLGCEDTSIQPPDGILPLRVVGSLGCLRGLPHHGHPESPRPTVPRAQSRWSLPDCGGHGPCWLRCERAQLADFGRFGRKRGLHHPRHTERQDPLVSCGEARGQLNRTVSRIGGSPRIL